MSEEVNNRPEKENSGEKAIRGLYEDWFLDYASYVILERAVPALEDGLKPVQRRILHSMKLLDDGRYNKVANIIGYTMQFHPHGDAAIGDAMVNMGQKELLIDTQGNWGDIRTGDGAAAPRYIEARLTKFALDVVFNKQTTKWQKSYDGRKQEPVTLPVKFPLLLAQGVEGIAVGLSTRILPHNFIELIKASIDLLKGKNPGILPDFATGGYADFSDYNEGRRGGRVRIRAKIEEKDKKTLIIREIPFGTTTSSVIDSIIKANDKGKIKVKKVVDNSARDLEIEVHLAPGISPKKTIDALYAFSHCEVSVSPNACVIFDDKPHFLSVNEILRLNTENTVELLKQELLIKKAELEEKWHFSSLEKIFIEERIYRDIEECETWEEIISTIDKGLDPFKKKLRREVTEEDITKLTEIRIKRISRFDSFKADEILNQIEEDLKQVNTDLDNLTEYAIAYFKDLLTKYGKGRERRTEIREFDNINATVVAVANEKLYANFDEGFVGTGLKKETYITDCSDLDDIIVFREDGKYKVDKVSQKAFFGKNIIHVDIWRKGDERKVYNAIYLDGKSGKTFAKRFSVTSVTRDKEYDITKGTPGSKLLYFSANPNAEAEVVTIQLHGLSKARIKTFDFDFSDLLIKGRGSKGNTVTKYRVRKISLKEKGRSTIGGRDIWYEPGIGKLNIDGRGEKLGSFQTDDLILVVYHSGEYELTSHELTNRYEPNDVALLEKFNPDKVVTCIYFDGKNKAEYVKRFQIETTTVGKRFLFITESRNSRVLYVTTSKSPVVQLFTKNSKGLKKEEVIDLNEFIDVRGWKAQGNKLTYDKFVKLTPVDSDQDDDDDTDPDDGKKTKSKKETVKNEKKTDSGVTVDEVKAEPEKKESTASKASKTSGKKSTGGAPKKKKTKDVFTSGDQLNLL